MARPNETQRLEKALEIIPLIQKGCLSFDEIAEMMGCPVEDAVIVMRELAACEVDGEPLDFHFVEASQAKAALKLAMGSVTQTLEKLTVHGGIIVSEGFGALSPQMTLKPSEVQALLAALDLMHVGANSPLRDKIRARATSIDALDSDALIAFIADADTSATLTELALLCEQHRFAEIEYAEKTRVVAPLEIFRETNGLSYLWAYDRNSKLCKTFRVDRITFVEPMAEHATSEILEQREHAPLFTKNVGYALLEMPVDEPIEKRIWFGAETVEEHNGLKQIRVPLQQNHTWIVRQIAARFGHIRIIEPAELGDEVRAFAKTLLDEEIG